MAAAISTFDASQYDWQRQTDSGEMLYKVDYEVAVLGYDAERSIKDLIESFKA